MQVEQLFSYPLHTELWDHNLVNNIDFVISQHHDLQQYKEFLENQARDKVIEEFKQRKNILNEVQDLLQEESLTPKENEEVSSLLKRLGLRFDEDGFITLEELDPITRKYPGVKEPHLSQWERQLIEEEKRLVVLRRDLKTLKKWLVSLRTARAIKPVYSSTIDWKEFEGKCRQRTERRWKEMAKKRQNKIILLETETDSRWKKICGMKNLEKKIEEFPKSVKKTSLMKPSVATPTLFSDMKSNGKKEDGMYKIGSPDKGLPTAKKQKETYLEKTSKTYCKKELERKKKDLTHGEKLKARDFRKRIPSSLVTSIPPGFRLRPADYKKPEIKRRLQKFQNMIDVHTRERVPEDKFFSELRTSDKARLKMTEKDYKPDTSKRRSREEDKYNKRDDISEDKERDIDKDTQFIVNKLAEDTLKVLKESIENTSTKPKKSKLHSANQDLLAERDLENEEKLSSDYKQKESYMQYAKDIDETIECTEKKIKSEPSLISKDKYKEEIEVANDQGSIKISNDSIKEIEDQDIIKSHGKITIVTDSDKSKDFESFEDQGITSLLRELLDEVEEGNVSELQPSKDVTADSDKKCNSLLAEELDALDESQKYERRQNVSVPDINDETKSEISLEDEDVNKLIQRLVLNILESDIEPEIENEETVASEDHVQQKLNSDMLDKFHKELAERIVHNITENLELDKIIRIESEDPQVLQSERISVYSPEKDTEDIPLIEQDTEGASMIYLKDEYEFIDTEMDEMKSIKDLVQDIINAILVLECITDREMEHSILKRQKEETKVSVLDVQNFENTPGRYSSSKQNGLNDYKEKTPNEVYNDLVQEMLKRIPASEIFIDRIEGINDLCTLLRTCIGKDLAKDNEVQKHESDLEMNQKKNYLKRMEKGIDNKSIEEELHKAYLESYLRQSYFKKMKNINENGVIENETETICNTDTDSESKVTPDIEKISLNTEHLQGTDDSIIHAKGKVIESVYKKMLDAPELSRKASKLRVLQDLGESKGEFSESHQRNFHQEKLNGKKFSLKSSEVLEDSRNISTENIEFRDLMSSTDEEMLANIKNKAEDRMSLFAEQSISKKRSFEKVKDEHNLKFKHLFPIKSESENKGTGKQNVKIDKNDEQGLKFELKPGTSKSGKLEKNNDLSHDD